MLPEKLETAELPAGNALVEGATFLAILIGTIAGGIAVAEAKSAELVVAVILALAVASWAFARLIPAAGPAAPGLAITANPWTSTVALLRELQSATGACGAARTSSPGSGWSDSWRCRCCRRWSRTIIGGSEGVVTTCLAVFTVGIAIGSALAAGASHGRPNLSLVPLGALLMGVSALAHRLGCLDVRPGAGADRSRRAACVRAPAWRCWWPCAGLPSPAGFSSCRRLRPCRPGRPSTGARA